MPLLTFANLNYEQNTCIIYVEYQTPASQDPYTVLLGSLFFQAIYARFEMSGNSAINVTLQVNSLAQNTLAYVGNATEIYSPDFNVFRVKPLSLTFNNQQGKTLFTQVTSVNGIGVQDNPFMIDFNSNTNLVWAQNCYQ